MTLYIISDTHGLCGDRLSSLAGTLTSGDYLVHCGDGAADPTKLALPPKCRFVAVRGNCDLLPALPRTAVLELPFCRILVAHGHDLGAGSGDPLGLYYAAAEHDCSYVFYGHTHVADISIHRGITFINPGSLARPRLLSPSYAVAWEENGQLAAKIVHI